MTLPFIVAASISLRAAAAFSLGMLLINLVTATLSDLLPKRMLLWVRAPILLACSTGVMVATRSLIISTLFPNVLNYLGTYIYLMGLNGAVLVQIEARGRRHVPFPALRSALRHWAAFTALMFTASIFREYFGAGMLWGMSVPHSPVLPGILLPFFGFILVGFMLAAIKILTKRGSYWRYREYARQDAVDRARYTEIHIDMD